MLKEIRKTSRRAQFRSRRTKMRTHAHTNRPRLVVHRSNRYIYAQILSDGTVLASASSLKMKGKTPIERASQVGTALAAAAVAKQVQTVAFDRQGYKYHGQVKALAEGARSGGLKF